MVFGLLLEMRNRLPRLAQDVVLPGEQLLAEVLELALVHKLFGIRRPIAVDFLTRYCGRRHWRPHAKRFSPAPVVPERAPYTKWLEPFNRARAERAISLSV